MSKIKRWLRVWLGVADNTGVNIEILCTLIEIQKQLNELKKGNKI